ncbi:MAG: peptidoglycan-binding protein [Deltaproteobacteria bacterium]|nr:peptidoglycan-binding protein [Deltaproteobacteria bacterium]
MSSTTAIRTPTVIVPPGYRAAADLAQVKQGRATLQRGDAGDSVRELQELLIRLGHLAPQQPSGRPANDGIFGDATKKAVARFQRAKGLNDDGVVGKNTAQALPTGDKTKAGKDHYELGVGTPTGKKSPEQVNIPDYRTPGGTLVHAVSNNYEPRTTAQKVVPRDKKLLAYLEKQETGMGKLTDPGKAATELEDWGQRHPKVLKKLGISDLRHLSPRQAIALSQEVGTDLVEWAKAGTLGQDRAIDQQGLDQTLASRRQGDAEKGACRNFAEVTHSTFQILKGMQDPATDRLKNTYAVDNSGGGHRTTAFVTLEPDGKAMATVVDAAWNNHDTMAEGGKGATDYTFHRAHNDKNTSVRYGYFLRNMSTAIGDTEQQKFLDSFDTGIFRGAGAGDGKLSPVEISQNGGISALNQALERLPVWSRGSMLETLQPESLVELNALRAQLGQAPISFTSGENNLQYHSGQTKAVADRDRIFAERYRFVGITPNQKKAVVPR